MGPDDCMIQGIRPLVERRPLNLDFLLSRDLRGHDAAPTAALKRERLGLATVLRGPRPTLGGALQSRALVETSPPLSRDLGGGGKRLQNLALAVLTAACWQVRAGKGAGGGEGCEE